MGLSALSSPTNGLLHGSSLDRLTGRRSAGCGEESDGSGGGLGGGTVWQPRPVDRESMARITQYFTQASLSTHGKSLYKFQDKYSNF